MTRDDDDSQSLPAMSLTPRTASHRIVNKLGLHARAATRLVKLASGFASEIGIHCEGKQGDAKSIMGVMLLAASKGKTVELAASGEDAEAALRALGQLIDSGFGESE